MASEFENKLKELHENMKLELSYITLRTEVNTYLKGLDEELAKSPSSFFVWGTKYFNNWMKKNHYTLDDVMDLIEQYTKSSIIILGLSIKEYNALLKADIRTLKDLKELAKDPRNLLEVTGLGFEVIEKILKRYSEVLLKIGE